MPTLEGHNPDVLTCLANLSSDEVFTPPDLANQVLDLLPAELWRDPNARFLDPACKSGVFLREIARRLEEGLRDQIPDHQERVNHILKNQVFGIAITELTALLSRRSVYCSKTANGKYSVCTAFDTEDGNIRFRRVEHTWQKGRCVFCGANQAGYERGEALETHAYEFIHSERPEEIFDMQFDVIVSNPPYQLSTEGSGVQAIPLYHRFIETALALQPRYVSMIVPARWFSGGFGLDSFRARMLADNRIRQIHDYLVATDCFPGVQIKGGVCYFLWDRDNPGLCSITTYHNGAVSGPFERPLLMPGSDVFLRYSEAPGILSKIQAHGETTMDALVSAQKPFGLATTFVGATTRSEGDVLVYGSKGEGYVAAPQLTSGQDLVPAWKVFVPRAGSGSDTFPHPILGQPIVGRPGTACTETYVVVGPFSSEQHCNNFASYLRTRLFRFLVLLRKPTQDALRKVYGFVPMQDFSKPWTDEELYKKYGLTEDEIAFIESMVRPMEPNGES